MRHDFSSELFLQKYQNGVKLVHPEKTVLHSNQLSKILQLPFNVFFFDNNSIIRHINNEQANSFGYTPSDFIGQSLSKLMSNESLIQLKFHNDVVIKQNSSKIIEEEMFLKNDFSLQSLSFKFPWYNSNNEILGVFGLAIILNKHCLATSLSKISELGFLQSTDHPLDFSNVYLTTREKEILKFVLKGYTSKKIAKLYSISPRTVEAHLLHIKAKFKVNSRIELIDLFS